MPGVLADDAAAGPPLRAVRGGKVNRGVGLHYRTEGLTPDKFRDWVFENINVLQTDTPDLMICGDHARSVFFSYVPPRDKLRIGVFGEMTEEQGWDAIGQWAERFARGTECNLEAIERDLFEGGVCVGHWSLPLAPSSEPANNPAKIAGKKKKDPRPC